MIREANVNDSSRISEIKVFGWRCAYKDFISIDFLFNELSVKSSYEILVEIISNKEDSDKIFVYEEDNIVKGYMIMGDCLDYDKNYYTSELKEIYIDPLFQRQHIGTQLVKYIIQEAKNSEKREIIVWVFDKNKNAILFYEKMGFKVDGKTEKNIKYNEYKIRMKIEL